MRSFQISRVVPGCKDKPVLQGWGLKKDVESAFRALCKLRKSETLKLEW